MSQPFRIDSSKIFTCLRTLIETFFKIIDKKGRLVPFHFNNAQEDCYDNYFMKYFWKPYLTKSGKIAYKLQGIRLTECKSRQYGGSTYLRAISFANTIINTGINNRIYCQNEAKSKEMLGKDKIFYDNLPKELRPKIQYNTTGYLSFPEIMSTIRAEKPGASITVAGQQGRSITIHELHISELSEWVNPDATMQGLLNCVPDEGNIYCEYSPRKIGDYAHRQYNSAKQGTNVFIPRFVPWFHIDWYSIKVTALETYIIMGELSERERFLVDTHNLTAGQIKWRRMKIKQLDSEKSFIKEYPENDIECFESGADLIFPEEVRRINCKTRKAIKGHFHTIGVDVGGGGNYSDNSSITVIDAITREQIYEEHLIIKPEDLPIVVYEVWKEYPGLVGIESNNDCGLTALTGAYKLIQDPNYPDWTEYIFSNNNARGGWWTSKANKKPTIFAMRLELNQVAKGLSGLHISSEQIISEMGWFQELDNGGMGSIKRTNEDRNDDENRLTDDSIMSLMIAYGLLDWTYQILDLFYSDFILPIIKIDRDFVKKNDLLMKYFDKIVI